MTSRTDDSIYTADDLADDLRRWDAETARDDEWRAARAAADAYTASERAREDAEWVDDSVG